MRSKLTSDYQGLGEYYEFDVTKITQDGFFRNISAFKSQFKVNQKSFMVFISSNRVVNITFYVFSNNL